MRTMLCAVALSATLLFSGCDDPTAPPQTNLPDSLLVEALIGAHIAGARAARSAEDMDSLRNRAYAELRVDSLDVARALDVYAERPEVLAALYSRIADRLREMHEIREASGEVLPDTTE